MYVTRTLSHYKSNPEALYLPPEGPNSGYLVIEDKESETYSLFGLWKNKYLPGLPFPQNKTLTTRSCVNYQHVSYNGVVFIPVLNQPLSSNRYYVIKPHGSHKGEAFACSKEEDMRSCFFCNCARDVKPRPLDADNKYQQFEIVPYYSLCKINHTFYAKSIAEDGHPPCFLRRGWEIYSKTPKNYELQEAKGTNDVLRSRLPDLNFLSSTIMSNPVVVGKWYCPFMFIKEGNVSDQMKKSMFYEMTLEQKWERIFEQENQHNNKENHVSFNASFGREAVFLGDIHKEAVWDENNVVDGAIWFKPLGSDHANEESVGLNLEIIERMKWEEERVGWTGTGEKKLEKAKREEKFEGMGVWKRFACYVLIERFVLKRMDGSLVLTYDFGHSHQIKTIFE